MATIEDTFTPALAAALSSLALLPSSVVSVQSVPDDSLLSLQSGIAGLKRLVDAAAALVAGEVKHRSRRELGNSGLAQSTGYRTAEKLVQHVTGSTAREAVTLVNVGVLVHASAAPTPSFDSHLHAVGVAVSGGSLSVAAAEAISRGLGLPSASVTAAQLAAAADVLLLESLLLDADALYLHARDLRDALDASGVASREQRLHEARGLRRVRRPDGCLRIIIDTDIESGAYFDDVCDKLLSPRRGGPRFVDPESKAWAERIAADPRTPDQYLHDSILGLLRIGVTVDTTASRQIVGSRQPAVRVLVTADALSSGDGVGHVEGGGATGSGGTGLGVSIATVSISTVERLACADGTIALNFDLNGQPLKLGRTQRLFSTAQRIALAARDGGCRWTDCDRPPSWTEAHHIDHWLADGGRTDVADGILLCRHHHRLLHTNGWKIQRECADYFLVPPAGIDPLQTPILLPSKSAGLRDLLASASK